jgi:ribosomal 30S subunit maturation factor RimM
VIKTNRGELVDVPYVEAFFKDIDLDNAVVTVEMPEEME